MQCAPAARGSAQSSVWSECDGDCVIALCSTGITISRDARSLRIQRGALQPQLRERPAELLRDSASWVLRWETWVDEIAGYTWRDETLASRTRLSPWNASELRGEWASTLVRLAPERRR